MPPATLRCAEDSGSSGLAFAGRRFVVTGAAGFMGSHLCEHLVSMKAQVVGVDNISTGCLDNLSSLKDVPEFELIEHDVTVPFEVAGRVDYVLHLASPASPRDYAELPLATLKAGAFGTLHALELARAKGARFLLASTSEVYGDPLAHPQHEGYAGNVNPVGPRSVYDEAKRYAEALTSSFRRDCGTDTAIVRIFNTYGPGMRPDDGRAVPSFIQQARSGRPLTIAGDGSQTRSLCYVTDTVAGVLALAASHHAGPLNVGNPYEITILQLAKEIRRLCRSSSPIEFVPLPVDDPRRRCPDITMARTLLGWTPVVGLEEGLSCTLAGTDEHETPGSRRRAGRLAADDCRPSCAGWMTAMPCRCACSCSRWPRAMRLPRRAARDRTSQRASLRHPTDDPRARQPAGFAG